ncbi:MAG: hypothetical protein AAGF12_01230 [Myxococcota bacterium]
MSILNPLTRLAVTLALTGLVFGNRAAATPLVPWNTHPSDRHDERFDAASVAECLEAGRRALDTRPNVLQGMTEGLAHPRRVETSCDEPGLVPFDGHWDGTWGAQPVQHLWVSVTPELQLVVFDDGDSVKHGVNLWFDGVLCGIVRSASGGAERLHEGQVFPASRHSPAYIKWLTPDRIYYERVACEDLGRVYEIVELIPTRRRLELGTRARYREPDVEIVSEAVTERRSPRSFDPSPGAWRYR